MTKIKLVIRNAHWQVAHSTFVKIGILPWSGAFDCVSRSAERQNRCKTIGSSSSYSSSTRVVSFQLSLLLDRAIIGANRGNEQERKKEEISIDKASWSGKVKSDARYRRRGFISISFNFLPGNRGMISFSLFTNNLQRNVIERNSTLFVRTF